MIAQFIVIIIAVLLFFSLAALIGFADVKKNSWFFVTLKPFVYGLTLALFLIVSYIYALYNMAFSDGWILAAVGLGPLLVFAFGFGFLKRIAKIVHIQNIKSLPDLLSARYGKKTTVSIISTLLILILALPYLGMQLWYIDYSTGIIIAYFNTSLMNDFGVLTQKNSKLLIVILLFFVGFVAIKSTQPSKGTHGVLFVIALCSIASIILVAVIFTYIVYFRFDGLADLLTQFSSVRSQEMIFKGEFSLSNFIVMIFLSGFAFIAMPWQFMIIFGDNIDEKKLTVGRKLLLPYLLGFFALIVPVGIAIIVIIKNNNMINFDLALLTTMLGDNVIWIGLLFYFVSLISSVLLMVIGTLAISTMISNDIVLPLLLKTLGGEGFIKSQAKKSILLLKRCLIVFTLVLGYFIYLELAISGQYEKLLYNFYMILFQLAPAMIGGIYWHRATAKGVIAGLIAGLVMWAITSGQPIAISLGIMNNSILNPMMFFKTNLDSYTLATFWITGVNILFFIIFSYMSKPDEDEVMQKNLFANINAPNRYAGQKSILLSDLQTLVGRYVGQNISKRRFETFANNQNISLMPNDFASMQFINFAENQLAGTIGSSSARFVMAIIMERKKIGAKSAIKLLDEASDIIQHNRQFLQSAVDNIKQGICVLDENLKLLCWNHAFQKLLNIPDGILENNLYFKFILEYCANKGVFGEGKVKDIVANRMLNYIALKKTMREAIHSTKQILEVTSSVMPEGGYVITFDNITAQVNTAKTLESVNINLEQRVDERTGELTLLNEQLSSAKANAEEANIDKTRFLAAASHDISQPMNAARLYSTALLEKPLDGEVKQIAQSLDLSLTSVEEILVALLDISRLDSGVFETKMADFSLNRLFEQLYVEFKPLADKKGLKLKYVKTKAYIKSDRRHLRRILQNYISNAIKYTEQGEVLFGCRHKGKRLRLDVYDTGHGVAPFQIKTIFKEFKRLESGMRVAEGVGLGLSIVDRISKMIGSELDITSKVDRGSKFSCYVDLGSQKNSNEIVESKVFIARKKLNDLNVICIDNEPEILNALKVLLGNWGVNGIYSETSKDALQQMQDKDITPHAIIADYHLNFENGVFAIEKIRWQVDKPIVAILATADRSEQVAKICRKKDIILMSKPIKPAVLRAVLTRAGSDKPA